MPANNRSPKVQGLISDLSTSLLLQRNLIGQSLLPWYKRGYLSYQNNHQHEL